MYMYTISYKMNSDVKTQVYIKKWQLGRSLQNSYTQTPFQLWIDI